MESISKSRGEILSLTKIVDWIDVTKETRNYFTVRIKEELGSLINTIRATILKGKLYVKYSPR